MAAVRQCQSVACLQLTRWAAAAVGSGGSGGKRQWWRRRGAAAVRGGGQWRRGAAAVRGGGRRRRGAAARRHIDLTHGTSISLTAQAQGHVRESAQECKRGKQIGKYIDPGFTRGRKSPPGFLSEVLVVFRPRCSSRKFRKSLGAFLETFCGASKLCGADPLRRNCPHRV